jgi:hypothetical protein
MAAAGAGPIHSKPKNEPKRALLPPPFQPPYVPGLYVGCLEGVDGDPTMSVLVSSTSRDGALRTVADAATPTVRYTTARQSASRCRRTG